MTNENISGFLNSIAEAKRAFDAEPEHLQRIADLEADQRRLGETVAARELRIHSLKQDNDALLGKLRSVEAERDDAGFRHLEADDKVQSLLTLVHGVIGDALKAVAAVEGVERTVIAQSVLNATNQEMLHVRDLAEERYDSIQRLEGEVQQLRNDIRFAQEQLQRPLVGATSSSNVEDMARLYTEQTNVGQREAVPTASVSAPIPQGLGQSETTPTASISQDAPNVAIPEVQSSHAFVASHEGQSEGPFAAPQGTQSEPVSSGTATSTTDAPSNASPPERNRDRSTFFTGRKYFDVTYFVPLHQWLNEGGSRDDYYWRPAEANVPLPEANRASHQS